MSDSETRLTYLLRQFANKEASEAEMRELTTLLEKDWEKTTPAQTAAHIDWHNMLETIKTEGRQLPAIRPIRHASTIRYASPVRFLAKSWLRSAAAILLVVGVGTVFYLTHKKQQEVTRLTPTPAADVLPGGNKATLTLASGQKIMLDSAHQGNLTVQGSAQVSKVDNGRLTYEAVGNAAATTIVYNTLSTPRGGQYELTLPDGTHVWLNAASSITYPTVFTGSRREVTMTGEAYFEVTCKTTQPFQVKVGNETIVDLGTHFNINAYAEEPTLRTTLLEGKVAVQLGRERRVLSPGQQAEATGASIVLRSGVDLDEAVAWKNGLFQFKRADIQTVMRQIARWYDVEVRFEGPISADRFWGKLPRDANASQVLRVLQKEQVHFRIEGKTIIVTQ
jgi:transmembrane sensor